MAALAVAACLSAACHDPDGYGEATQSLEEQVDAQPITPSDAAEAVIPEADNTPTDDSAEAVQQATETFLVSSFDHANLALRGAVVAKAPVQILESVNGGPLELAEYLMVELSVAEVLKGHAGETVLMRYFAGETGPPDGDVFVFAVQGAFTIDVLYVAPVLSGSTTVGTEQWTVDQFKTVLGGGQQ